MEATLQKQTIEKKRQQVIKRRKSLLGSFGRAAEAGKQKRLCELYYKIRETNAFLEALNLASIMPPPAGEKTIPRFIISSLFLHESFKKLTADKDEQFFFITGMEVEGVMVLDQWAEFAHERRSYVGVTADSRSTHRLLIKLEQFGHKLLAHFHSHPGNGVEATHPSGIDDGYQDRLEKAGHVAVMAIFSRDGFVRFVRRDSNFEVIIYGQGVEKHGENIFHLRQID